MKKNIIVLTTIMLSMIMAASLFGSEEGRVEKEIVMESHYGSANGEFGLKVFEDSSWVEPSAIAIDGDQNIYIADPLNDRIQKFNSKGKYISKIEFKVKKKYALTIDDLTTDDENNLYVLSRHEQKIFKYNSAGQMVYSINLQDYMQTERVSVDIWGNIYVFGVIPGRGTGEELRKFDKTGKLVRKWDKVYLFFVDREGYKYLRQETSWAKYDKDDQYLGEIKCETEKLKIYSESTCHFPPVFVDENKSSYYFVYDTKTEKIRTLIKMSPKGELRTYGFSSVDTWPWPRTKSENMIKFDSKGNLYGYNADDIKKQYQIIRIKFK